MGTGSMEVDKETRNDGWSCQLSGFHRFGLHPSDLFQYSSHLAVQLLLGQNNG